jgi:hypothetical protein
MSLKSGAAAGSFVTMTESTTTNTAGTAQQAVAVGNPSSGTTFTPGTGTATSVNVLYSNILTATTTLNFNTGATDAIGNKIFTKLRGLRITNGAADASGITVTITGTILTNSGAILGGTTPTFVLPAQGEICWINAQTAGWTVSASAATVILTVSSGTPSITVVAWGE